LLYGACVIMKKVLCVLLYCFLIMIILPSCAEKVTHELTTKQMTTEPITTKTTTQPTTATTTTKPTTTTTKPTTEKTTTTTETKTTTTTTKPETTKITTTRKKTKKPKKNKTTTTTKKSKTTTTTKEYTTIAITKTEKETTKETATTVKTQDIEYFVPQSERAKKSYFNDVVFIGDSVTLKLYYYNLKTDALGKAVFLTAGSFGYGNSLWSLNRKGNVHPSYNGTKMRVPDGVKASGRKKVYIMLGMNDVYLYGVDKSIDNAKKLVAEIKQKSPGAEIFIQSVTPVIITKKGITNELINRFNKKLSECCKEQKWNYLDVASVLKDKKGALPVEYCSDPKGMGIHFTDKACKKWVDYLYTHTK